MCTLINYWTVQPIKMTIVPVISINNIWIWILTTINGVQADNIILMYSIVSKLSGLCSTPLRDTQIIVEGIYEGILSESINKYKYTYIDISYSNKR